MCGSLNSTSVVIRPSYWLGAGCVVCNSSCKVQQLHRNCHGCWLHKTSANSKIKHVVADGSHTLISNGQYLLQCTVCLSFLFIRRHINTFICCHTSFSRTFTPIRYFSFNHHSAQILYHDWRTHTDVWIQSKTLFWDISKYHMTTDCNKQA